MKTQTLSREEIQKRVDELAPWFQNLSLNGVPTAPNSFLGDYPNVKWRKFAHAIPQDLTGKTVLEIGCNAGFYAMEMKRRGAARVVGIDVDNVFLPQAKFAAEVNGLDIDYRYLSVYDVAQLGEKFDIVLFMGVFYHLRHPLLALDLIHEHVAKDLLIFQTMQRGTNNVARVANDYSFWDYEVFEQHGYPCMYFVEQRYSADPTNWWIPNRACSEAMLRSSGFTILDHPEPEVYVCKWTDLPLAPDAPFAVHPHPGEPR